MAEFKDQMMHRVAENMAMFKSNAGLLNPGQVARENVHNLY